MRIAFKQMLTAPKKLFIQNTQIIVKNNSKYINNSEFKKIINLIEIALYRNKYLFIHAPKLFFEIKDKDSSGREVVRGNETYAPQGILNKPPYTIYIVARATLFRSPSLAINGIVHELEHFRDFTKSKQIRRTLASENLLQKKAFEFANAKLELGLAKITGNITPYKNKLEIWANLRTYYSQLFRNIQIEGLAKFSQENYRKEPHTYGILLKYAVSTCEKLSFIFKQSTAIGFLKTLNKKKRYIEGAPYVVGLFMVYNILYYKFRTLNELIQMSFMEFIQAHEALQVKLGQRVLVSITSGRGILDYKRLLDEAKVLLKV